jgi:hypothetical protein
VADLDNFSSFDPEVERTFVPFERSMRENTKRALTIGFGIGGGLFVLAALVVGFLYTPCSNYCSKPPSSCKADSDIAAFKRNCENACSALEHTSGLKLLHENKDEKTGKSETSTESVSGREYVEALTACAFSGGAGTTCQEVVSNATGRGLWCAEKN